MIKKIQSKLILSAIFIIVLSRVFAQTTNLGKPFSFNTKVNLPKEVYSLPPVDNQEKLEHYEKLSQASKEKMLQYGFPFESNINLFESSKKTLLGNGINLYQFVIESKNAFSINLIFDEFRLEQGTIMYIFAYDKSSFIGAYTSLNNNKANELGTELIYSDKIVIEIQEPIANEQKSRLSIGKIIHGFIHLDNYFDKALNSSGSCNIDINCPEGSGWEIPRNSVAMLVNGNGGFCSGAMVNNTSGQLIPYFLTANHCGNSPANWVFRFRWESPAESTDCGTTSPSGNGPENMNINGGVTRAKNVASDFHLIELNSTPLEQWEVTYNGWDRTENSASSGAGIHHPAGDIKKIAVSSSPFESAFYFGSDLDHWKAYWSDGVTEGGSSGSPLFNQQRRIVGQLHGGASGCSSDDQSDLYGKFSVSWIGGGTNSTRLKNWLDPQNTGLEFIDGNVVNAIDPILGQKINGLEKTVCGNTTFAKIPIINGGANVLTSATINYSINGTNFSINWNGNLGFYETDTITVENLPLVNGVNTFQAIISNPNGGTDNNMNNNMVNKNVFAIVGGGNFELTLNLDCYADETSWKLVDMNLNTLFEQNSYPAQTLGYTVTHNFCLNNGCYDFYIYDSYGDGLTSNNCDSGSYFIRNVQNNDTLSELRKENANFLYSNVQNFCVEGVTAINEKNIVEFLIFPNPSTGNFLIKSNEFIEDIELYDVLGKSIFKKENLNQHEMNVDLNLTKGVYYIQINSTKSFNLQKIVVQ